MIPILDLTEQYRNLKAEMDSAIQAVLESGIFIMGPNVAAFESEIAEYLETDHAISLNSGTDALHLALRALDIGPGDEVITSPFTFAATTEAIGIVGATPVFVDIDPATYNIDNRLIEAAITPRTKAIMPVHLYGAPVAMEELSRIARDNKLAVVEDCAQAIGAEINGRKVGTFGEIGCFSFFPSKNLGAYGDGGLAIAKDAALAARLRSLRVHGGQKKYYHEQLGVNSRLDEIQAAVLRVKLPHLDKWIERRRALAHRYSDLLASCPALNLPVETPGVRHVYHQYTVRVEDRDKVRADLTAQGVQTMVYYPIPLHLQKVHENLSLQSSNRYVHSEKAAAEVLSVPMYPELTFDMQNEVVRALNAVLKSSVSA